MVYDNRYFYISATISKMIGRPFIKIYPWTHFFYSWILFKIQEASNWSLLYDSVIIL